MYKKIDKKQYQKPKMKVHPLRVQSKLMESTGVMTVIIDPPDGP